MTALRFRVLVLICAAAGTALRAQCPDGSPPPCGATRVATAARRVDPPLDDRTWIVVPFNNVTRAPDADWLRDASVNLLYLDLSRWQDIRVVDDARVADLVRQMPEARTPPLSLEGATAMARRAGARMLVMGSFIKQGARTTLAAKVFDIRKGSLVRSAQQDLTVQDSLMPVFGRLAQGILNLAAPTGVDIANVGTSRVDAYQEYLAGTKALNRFDLTGARPHFEQALKLDSTFALAHYKLGVVIGWESAADTTRRGHAAAAERLSGSLPARERSLMKGFNAFEHGQYTAACLTYGALVKADSSDIEAQYGLGECSYHNPDVVVAPGSPPAFQGSYNTAIRAFQRALELDPTYHIAFQHILDALAANNGRRTGFDHTICPGDQTTLSCTYQAFIRRDHDTLVTAPLLVTDTALATQLADYVKSDARRKNLEQARATAERWVASAPDESRPHNALGAIYGQLGDATSAEAQFTQVKGKLIDTESSKYLVGRTEALTQLGRAAQLHWLLDSALKSPDRRSDLVPQQLGVLIGRFAPVDSTRPVQNGINGAYQGIVAKAVITGGDEVVAATERAFIDLMRTNGTWTDTAPSRLPTFQAALRMPRTWPPLVYPKTDHLRASVVVAVAKGDTARLRAEARWMDSVVVSRPTTVSDSGTSVILADAFLVLHDSTSALRVVRRALDSIWVRTPTTSTPMLNNLPVILAWPRMTLLRGELEAAVGSKPAAREWLQRFLDLWAGADPEFAPMLARAHQGLALLGSGG